MLYHKVWWLSKSLMMKASALLRETSTQPTECLSSCQNVIGESWYKEAYMTWGWFHHHHSFFTSMAMALWDTLLSNLNVLLIWSSSLHTRCLSKQHKLVIHLWVVPEKLLISDCLVSSHFTKKGTCTHSSLHNAAASWFHFVMGSYVAGKTANEMAVLPLHECGKLPNNVAGKM